MGGLPMAFGGYVQNDIAKILDNIASAAPSAEVAVVRMLSEWQQLLQLGEYRAAMSAARRAWKLVQDSPGQIAPQQAAATAIALAHSLVLSGSYGDAEAAYLDAIAI